MASKTLTSADIKTVKWAMKIPEKWSEDVAKSKWFKHPQSIGPEAPTCWRLVIKRFTSSAYNVYFEMRRNVGKDGYKYAPGKDFDVAIVAAHVTLYLDGKRKRGTKFDPAIVCELPDETLHLLGLCSTWSAYTSKEETLSVVSTMLRKGSAMQPSLSPRRVCQIGKVATNVLWEKRKFTDVTLVARDGQIEAHKLVLMNASPVFEAMFTHEFEEKMTNVVKMPDVSRLALETALRFLYTGQLNKKNDFAVAVELLGVAERYNLAELKSACEHVLRCNIARTRKPTRAQELLQVTDLYGLADLKAYCERKILSSSSKLDKDLLKLAADAHSDTLKKVVSASLAMELSNKEMRALQEGDVGDQALHQELTALKKVLAPVRGNEVLSV